MTYYITSCRCGYMVQSSWRWVAIAKVIAHIFRTHGRDAGVPADFLFGDVDR